VVFVVAFSMCYANRVYVLKLVVQMSVVVVMHNIDAAAFFTTKTAHPTVMFIDLGSHGEEPASGGEVCLVFVVVKFLCHACI